MDRSNPILYIIIPCYNEEEVLPATAPLFLKKIEYLIASGKISNDSKILFVNDGSKDSTWDIISKLLNITVRQSRLSGVARATCPD